jgi:hypothetical protein
MPGPWAGDLDGMIRVGIPTASPPISSTAGTIAAGRTTIHVNHPETHS